MAPKFEPFDPSIYDDPYPTYARLRAEAPLYRGPTHKFWTLSRFADIKAALGDYQLYSSDIMRGGIGITPEEAGGADLPEHAHELPAGNLIVMDPPRHTAYRKPIAKRFLQKNMAPFEKTVREVVDGLIDGFIEVGSVDIVEDFASAVPALVFADVLGVPQSSFRNLHRWAAELTTVPTTSEGAKTHQGAVAAVAALFAEMLPYKRANPADDLLTDMAMATGDDATYSERDFVGMATSMLIAGNDTTANLLASAIYLLAKYPDQRALLIDDPSLMGDAVEEILRYEPPVHGLARVLTRDTELYGQPLSEGEKVLLLYASGNRDERVFADSETFDVRREITQHLSFGHGVHYCVGLHLGRLESRIALGAFLERIPDYDVALDDVHWRHIFATRQMKALPSTFTRRDVRPV